MYCKWAEFVFFLSLILLILSLTSYIIDHFRTFKSQSGCIRNDDKLLNFHRSVYLLHKKFYIINLQESHFILDTFLHKFRFILLVFVFILIFTFQGHRKYYVQKILRCSSDSSEIRNSYFRRGRCLIYWKLLCIPAEIHLSSLLLQSRDNGSYRRLHQSSCRCSLTAHLQPVLPAPAALGFSDVQHGMLYEQLFSLMNAHPLTQDLYWWQLMLTFGR